MIYIRDLWRSAIGKIHMTGDVYDLCMAGCGFINRLSATTGFAPPGPGNLAMVVNKWAMSISRSFMAEQGRLSYCGILFKFLRPFSGCVKHAQNLDLFAFYSVWHDIG